jgi:hypothetical protein
MSTPALLTIKEVAAQLRLAPRTIYKIPFLRQRAVYPTPANPRWRQTDIDLYLAQHTGVGRNARRGGRSRRKSPTPTPRTDVSE